MKKRYLRTLIASLVMSSFVISTAYASPDPDAIKEKKEAAQSEVDSLQSQLTEVLTEINDLETKLIEKGQEITQATADLEAAEKKEEEQYEAMKLRIKYMYEEGNNSALEKITESGSISELLTQAEYVQSVHNYDRKQLEEYVKTKEEIAVLKDKLETEQKELEETQEEFSAKKESLDATLAEKKEEVADLEEQFQAAVEAAAKEAEEKARREAAAAAAAQANNNRVNSGNSNSSSSNTTSYIVFAAKDTMPSSFYYFLIRNSHFVTFALQFMNGSSGRQRVSGEELASFPLVKPSDENLKAFDKVGAMVLAQMKENTDEIQKLKQLQEIITATLSSR